MREEFRAGGVGYGHFKQRLFEALWEYFAPIRERREALVKDPEQVESILRDGAERARVIAAATMERVRKAVGLR